MLSVPELTPRNVFIDRFVVYFTIINHESADREPNDREKQDEEEEEENKFFANESSIKFKQNSKETSFDKWKPAVRGCWLRTRSTFM